MKVSDAWRDIKWWAINCWKYRRTLKTSKPWDYSGMLCYIQDFCDSHIEYGYPTSLHTKSKIKHLKVIRELARRIETEGYLLDKFDYEMVKVPDTHSLPERCGTLYTIKVIPKHDFPVRTELFHNTFDLRKQDLKALFRLLEKHLPTFWD